MECKSPHFGNGFQPFEKTPHHLRAMQDENSPPEIDTIFPIEQILVTIVEL
jgi:hypothetical protein